jgi:hypothetical protein
VKWCGHISVFHMQTEILLKVALNTISLTLTTHASKMPTLSLSCCCIRFWTLYIIYVMIVTEKRHMYNNQNSLFPYGKWVVRQMCVRGIEFLFRFRNCSYSYSVLFLGFHFIQECWLLERCVILSTRQTNLLNVNTIYSTHFIHRI